MELLIKRLSSRATLPSPHSALAAGLDLCAANDAPIEIQPGEIRLVPLGFAMAVPGGFEAQIRPRSGLASRHGITLPNAPGTIDADYRGEVVVPLVNLGRERFVVEQGMRIAQMIVAPVVRPSVREVDELDETVRGDRGFGSTGLKSAAESPTAQEQQRRPPGGIA
ncbi:MAG TPA: dUTP diphosphatase [Phycisphaerales bacterium]|nr:dUTP diphosphatase [Phycisphaerales bacterium]HMP35965.1 dUTP diphosphatase [Phycisphaerales bacterium]